MVLLNREPTCTWLISAEFFATLSTLLEPKYHMYLGNFTKFRWKKSQLSVLLENRHTQYLGGADSKSTLIFLKFRPKIYIWANSGQKSQSCFFCLKMDTHSMVKMLILIPTLIFSIPIPKSIFSQIWAEKVKIIMFKILFPPDFLHHFNWGYCVPYVVFTFCELIILSKKVKVVCFA